MSSYSSPSNFSRRDFLKASGTLTVSVYLLQVCGKSIADPTSTNTQALPGSLRRTPEIDAWIQIQEDGKIIVFSGKVELGQGIRIAVKQMAAEELCQSLDQIEVILAETGRTPDEGYTAGSGSIQSSAIAVRYASAAARAKLMNLAAEKLNSAVDKMKMVNGGVEEQGTGNTLTFNEILAGKQISEKVTLPVDLMSKSAYKYVGKSIKREDVAQMVNGATLFIHDLQFPNMLHARVLRPLNYQSELQHFDESTFKDNVKGLQKVVIKGRFLGAITDTEYQAEKAMRAMKQYSDWSTPLIFPDQTELPQFIRRTSEDPKEIEKKGQWENMSDTSTVKRSYFKPYTMHASMGPACAIALFEDDILHVWTHSQGIYPLRRALASMLGMNEEQLHLISVPGAGCFGHTVADDAAADAALLAMELPGRHIRVQWTRQDEHVWEPYGSAMLIDLEAGLNDDGKINFWKSDVWTDSHSTRPNKEAGTVLAARHIDVPFEMQSRGYLGGGHRNADPYYDIPNLHVKAHFFDGPLRVSSLRSLGAYANIFAIESLMDELADSINEDSLSFRLKHLSDPRAIETVKRLQEITANVPIDEGEGIGYAFARYKNYASYCAVAAKVSVDPSTSKVRMIKCWATVDVGEVINPDGLKNQVEGGITQAASWTLKEAVGFDKQSIITQDWNSYPILSMNEVFDIEVLIIDRPEEDAMGGGEVSVPPTGAAITNAIYRACGKRVCELPVKL